MKLLTAIVLLAACGAPECPRVSQYVRGNRCYPEEVGLEPCAHNTTGRIRCVETGPDPLGGTERTGIYEWVDAGRECFPP